ncbi:hypothetical protein CH380_13150 [Leptospira adleri]|uniref:Uncharacterized protein n=1 Tax=Leptospira adleri TaxID=2023186 RepID=A0A2M9YMF4_9LEPT|nr:hypothetical protein CH380_13150 [Leptospira adleri]PJZ60479.1 hypothetical protein CH376_18135 [Leptospira adleri]
MEIFIRQSFQRNLSPRFDKVLQRNSKYNERNVIKKRLNFSAQRDLYITLCSTAPRKSFDRVRFFLLKSRSNRGFFKKSTKEKI